MNKPELINLLIGLLALAYTAGILQPFNQDPVPEPVPYVLCVPQPPATTCLQIFRTRLQLRLQRASPT